MNDNNLIYDDNSLLLHYGEDLSKRKFVTNPAIGREEEIKKMILTLLMPEKSVILVGKPGIGKTALVEGLAYKMQQGDIPDALKKYRIVKMNTSALVGSVEKDGMTDSKMQLLIEELKNVSGVILFIDEIHSVIGTGANKSSMDFANMLKAGLDRGTIKVIGATTSDEFDYYIVKDRAFLRRFEKIEISEPNQEMTVKILIGTMPKIEQQTGVKLDYSSFTIEQVMKFITNMTSEYKRIFESTSRYPDVTLALLNKMFSFAIYDNSNKVTFKHIWEAIKTCESVYPDVLTKEKIAFKKEFASYLSDENVYTYE